MNVAQSLSPPDDSATQVRARIQALIDSGRIGPEGRLPPERDLSQQLGVGRRAIRRALEALEAEGMVWRRQGKGTFAGLPPDPTQVLAAGIVGETTVMEVMEARLCIEPALAAMCARHALPADVARMRALAQRVAAAADSDSRELWDSALHRLIARSGGNKPLLTAFSLLDEIRSNPTWRGLRSRARSPDTLTISEREHAAIIDAIEAGDAPAAEARMRDHLTTLAGNLRRILPPTPAP